MHEWQQHKRTEGERERESKGEKQYSTVHQRTNLNQRFNKRAVTQKETYEIFPAFSICCPLLFCNFLKFGNYHFIPISCSIE